MHMKAVFDVITSTKTLANLRVLGMSVLVVGLAACGGGGDSVTAPPPAGGATISAANARAVTGDAIGAGMGSLELGGSLGLVGVETSNAAPNNRVLSRLTANAVKKIMEQRSAPESVTGVVTTLPCSGVTGDTASGTFSLDDFNGTTSVQMTFTNCKFDATETTNGTMTFSNLTDTVSGTSGTVSLNLTTTATGGSAVTVTGGFTFAITGVGTATETTVMTGSSLTMTEGALTETFSSFSFTSVFDINARIYTDSANFTLTSTTLGGSITFETLTPFQSNEVNLYPHVGVVHITGAGSTSLHVTILGNETLGGPQVRIDFDADGATPVVYENTSFVAWSALEL